MTPDYIYGTLVAIFYAILIASYTYLAACYKGEELHGRLRKGIEKYVSYTVFICWFALSHLCIIYVVVVYGTLTQLDDDITSTEVARNTGLRYLSTILFFFSSIMWVPSVVAWHESCISASTATISPILALFSWGLLIVGFIGQVLLPVECAGDCPPTTVALAVSASISSIFPLTLLIFDCFYSINLYFYERKFTPLPTENPGTFIHDTMEIGLA